MITQSGRSLAGFLALSAQMLELVSADGNAAPEDELEESDVILPP